MKATTKILVSTWTNNDSGPRFADLLPVAASPWWSMGDAETLRRIGEVLDTLPTKGSDEPGWDAAKKIAEIHREYTKPDGGYAAEYNRCPTGWYCPGVVEAAPIYGPHEKWAFKMRLSAAVGRTVDVFIGYAGQYETRDLVIDFKGPSENSAYGIRHELDARGIHYSADEVEVDEPYADSYRGPKVGEEVYSPTAQKVGCVTEIHEGYVIVDVGEEHEHAEENPRRFAT